MKDKLKKIDNNIYELPKKGKMLVSGRIFASERTFEDVEDVCVKQVANVAQLPGIVGYSLAMPDVHSGYGFPIGGVAAFDLSNGIISPGGVGYDINCGVRLLACNISKDEFMEKREAVMNELYKRVPSGVGEKSNIAFDIKELKEILQRGLPYIVEKGFGVKEDIDKCEDGGCIDGALTLKVSQKAMARGKNQLGSLGAGNHFLEVQEVEEIFDSQTAKVFGLRKGQICVMIHSGSRGLGHQVASDYIHKMGEEYGFKGLPDRELVCAPIDSVLGKDYRAAMAAAANFAFVNRQMISFQVRESFAKIFSKAKLKLVYDIAHNIAKFEEFVIDGKKKTLCVHRKGATRSFGPGRKEIPSDYREVGCPIFIPGSMGTASYVLVGTKKARELSFASTAHGAGRLLSRSFASKNISASDVSRRLKDRDVLLKAGSLKGVVQEAPEAYKDVDEVVRVSDELGIGKMVAKLRPLGVVKG
jgi:tRNA-splicing ligase RtcB (3'-phosphate/5'-hydroxy nucleic acid ligase)